MSAEWVAVDWGASKLRVWIIDAAGEVLAELASDQGTSGLAPDAFEPVLLEMLQPYLGDAPLPVICCGMVGAKQGWIETPYIAVPAAPPGAKEAVRAKTCDPRLKVYIVPGMMQAKPADVMRGEETQIAGFLAEEPEFFGTLCLPGTHTKWVQVSAGEVVSFRTFMTGELFSVLTQRSVLDHSMQAMGWSQEGFDGGVADGLSSPEQFSGRLFSLRAESLLNDVHPAEAEARLSGLLIGIELAGARGYWLGQDIALIGSADLTALYAQALGAQGVPVREKPAKEMGLTGLKSAYRAVVGESR